MFYTCIGLVSGIINVHAGVCVVFGGPIRVRSFFWRYPLYVYIHTGNITKSLYSLHCLEEETKYAYLTLSNISRDL